MFQILACNLDIEGAGKGFIAQHTTALLNNPVHLREIAAFSGSALNDPSDDLMVHFFVRCLLVHENLHIDPFPLRAFNRRPYQPPSDV